MGVKDIVTESELVLVVVLGCDPRLNSRSLKKKRTVSLCVLKTVHHGSIFHLSGLDQLKTKRKHDKDKKKGGKTGGGKRQITYESPDRQHRSKKLRGVHAQ